MTHRVVKRDDPSQNAGHAAKRIANVNSPGAVGARLRDDLEARSLSIRGFARLLSGDGASPGDVERKRRQVSKWVTLSGDGGLNPENAAKVASILGTDPARYLSGQYDRVRQLQRRAERLRADLSAVHAELDALESSSGRR